MKTLFSTLLISVFVLSISAQSESKIKSNMKYLNEVTFKDTPIKILKFRKIAANCNIHELKEFDAKIKSTYVVVFEETNCKIKALYNSDGQILSSTEEYKDIRMPSKLVKEVQKSHPKWMIYSDIYYLNYNSTEGISVDFEVKIKKGNESKVLKFKRYNQDSVIDYVAMN